MAKDARAIVTLACEVCKERNYTSSKNKKSNQDRVQLKKYCSSCRKHTVHKEIR